MPRVPLDGITLAVGQWPGPDTAERTVVAIHGLTANHVCWASRADLLSAAFRLVAYDLRGRGDSDKPASGYSLAHHGRDLIVYTVRLGDAPELKAALPAFLAGE